MKSRILTILLAVAMLLSFSACASEKYDLLLSVDHDGKTYCVRGTGTRAKQLVVKAGDELLWSKKVTVDRDVGSLDGTYGFLTDDLNFDGHRDLAIATAVAGDCYSYKCFLYNAEKDKYELSDVLSVLYNVRANAELKAVFGYTHVYKTEPAYQDVPASSTTIDAATKYVWEDGVLTPEIRVSLTHYTETSMYLYSIAYYDTESKTFVEDYETEAWLTEDEIKDYDLSIIYYFK